MSKVKLSDFTTALLRVHDSLIHASLETLPFDMISPYVRELMFLEQNLKTVVSPYRIASFHGLSNSRADQLMQFDEEVSKFFSTDPDLRVTVYRTLRVIYQLTYGIESISADRCEKA